MRAASWGAGLSIPLAALREGLRIGIVQDAKNLARLALDESGRPIVETIEAGARSTRLLGDSGEAERAWIRLRDLDLEIGIGAEEGRGTGLVLDASWLSTEAAGGFTGCLLGAWIPEHPLMAVLRLRGTAHRG